MPIRFAVKGEFRPGLFNFLSSDIEFLSSIWILRNKPGCRFLSSKMTPVLRQRVNNKAHTIAPPETQQPVGKRKSPPKHVGFAGRHTGYAGERCREIRRRDIEPWHWIAQWILNQAAVCRFPPTSRHDRRRRPAFRLGRVSTTRWLLARTGWNAFFRQ